MARIVPKIYPEDFNENYPIGIGFPLSIGTPRQNFTTTNQIHDNLRNLILTMKGERVMNPEFGSDIYFLLFEQLYESTLAQSARTAIKDAVAMWMPYVKIERVSVDKQEDKNTVFISVEYSVDGWQADSVLNLTVRV